jgi:uncharacterized protein (DUF433 family)
MRNHLKVVKTTKRIKVSDLLYDFMSGCTDEELLENYGLNWNMLHKVYCKLFYGGHISKDDLLQRVAMRRGKDAAHIPLVDIESVETSYECEACGYQSALHFSSCPNCRQYNLRRLHSNSPSVISQFRRPADARQPVHAYMAS